MNCLDVLTEVALQCERRFTVIAFVSPNVQMNSVNVKLEMMLVALGCFAAACPLALMALRNAKVDGLDAYLSSACEVLQ